MSNQKQTALQLVAYEQKWLEGLNRGDVSAADKAFAADCVIHITGSQERNLSVATFKEMAKGLLAAFPDLRFSIEDQIVAGTALATHPTCPYRSADP